LRRVGFRARSQRRQVQQLVVSKEAVRYGVKDAASFLKGGSMDRLDGGNRTSQPDLRGLISGSAMALPCIANRVD
jgi:hypothetical protein